MTEVWRCINGCFLEDIVFPGHAYRKLAILNSPRKVRTERGDEGKALKPLNSQNAKGEAFVPGKGLRETTESQHRWKSKTTGKGRPETPGVIDWINVSSYFNLEIAPSIKVREWEWWGWIITDFCDKSRIIYAIFHRDLC